MLGKRLRAVTSPFDHWVASLDGSVSPDANLWLRRLFDEHGPVSSDQADRMSRAYQLAAAREAVRLVGHDIAATTKLEASPFEYHDEEGVRLSYWGQTAIQPVLGLT
jgi:hypothetical protein